MSNDYMLMKRGRGSCDQFVRGDKKVSVLKWYDNKPIVMASSVHGQEPRDECRQWSKTEKEYMSHVGKNKELNSPNHNDFIDLALANAWFKYRHHGL